jgi:N-acetylmuramoyl-L-alanine amidase
MKICIDPGHGMSNRSAGIYDPGAVHTENGYQFQEAAIALRYCLALKDVLRAQGIDVFMTRDDDTDHTPVGQRPSMAKKAGCDALISIHLNDFDDDAANGLEVLYGNTASKPLAERLQTELLQITGMKDRKIKSRPELAVLKFQGIAVIIELGFIANDNDRNKLINAQVRDTVVRKIADCVTEV